jgi:hypothetical protein
MAPGLSIILLVGALGFSGQQAAVWMLAASQLALLLGEIRKGQVTGVGAFIFMSFLFFGVRPIYLILERDYKLFTVTFQMRPDLAEITSGMWWATASLACFAIGSIASRKLHRTYFSRRLVARSLPAARPKISAKMAGALIGLQCLTMPIMLYLASAGRSLYRSGFGAYAYDLPVPMQGVHIFALIVLLERYLRRRSFSNLFALAFSGILFLAFTWLMRDVSVFRGFYVAGLMVCGIAFLQRFKVKVGYAWLIIPIIAVQPIFQYLGQARGAENEELAEQSLIQQVTANRSLAQTYWDFYKSNGDINIFDTFVAAKRAEPAWYPYAWSWLYVPLHFIPRAIWSGKPRSGITQDVRFAKGAPYSPGIAGYFLLDGGLFWMLLSMGLLGYLIGLVDTHILTMRPGYLQACLIGAVVVNSMFLTRFFLWQAFYQMLYAIIPCIVLSWYFARWSKRARSNPQAVRSPRTPLARGEAH